MKTRERILECALQCFNARGEANVSVLEIATELGISQAISITTFAARSPWCWRCSSASARSWRHCCSRRRTMHGWPSRITGCSCSCWWSAWKLSLPVPGPGQPGRAPTHPARGVRAWLAQLKHCLASLLAQLQGQARLQGEPSVISELVEQITLTLLFALDYQRILGRRADIEQVVYQLMMLVSPHLSDASRQDTASLARRYRG